VLEQARVRYVVVGSVAASAWGVVRMTRDVDVVVVVNSTSGQTMLEKLANTGLYVPIESARRAIATGGSFNILHPPSGGKVDVFVMPASDRFTTQRLNDRVSAVVFDVSTWIDRAENVVLAKLRWRLKTRSETQWRDCVEIAAINKLDAHYLKAWAVELGVEDDLLELLAID